MGAYSLLQRLDRLGIDLWAQDGRMHFRGPAGAVTAALKAEIAEARAALLDILPDRPGGIPRLPPGRPAPASAGQRRLWLTERLTEGDVPYNLAAAWRLRGPLDPPALRDALNRVAARQAVLRTVFRERDGEPEPVVLPHLDLDVPVVDMTEAAVRRYAEAAVARPFDLARGPLLRLELLRLGPDHHVLLYVTHHIVTDGWSHGVLLRELRLAYAAARAGRAPEWPALPLHYADFAAWQATRRERLASDRDCWRARLAGVPVLELPTGRVRPAVRRFRGALLDAELSAAAAGAVRRLARDEAVSPGTVLLAAYLVLLYRLSGRSDLAVAVPTAGRLVPEVEPLVGFFVNTLVLRVDLCGVAGFRDLVRRVHHVMAEALSRQEVPFEDLIEAVRPERDAGGLPLAQVGFGWQAMPDEPLALDGMAVESIGFERGTTRFDLELHVWPADAGGSALLHGVDRLDSDGVPPDPAGFRMVVNYATDRFDRPTAASVLAAYRHLVAAAAGAPDTAPGTLPLGAGGKVAALDRGRALPGGGLAVPALFEAVARRQPDHSAVIGPDGTLSYADLDRRADRLARRLAACGVGPEDIVGAGVARSRDGIVALLGILKAGAAYLPLDPEIPAERLRLMLADARPRAVVGPRHAIAALPLDATVAVVALEDLDSDPDAPPLRLDLGPAHAAYVSYTSGSTGEPKGIVIPHGAIVNLALDNRYLRLTPEDRVAQMATVAFDAATFEIWSTLLAGATVVGLGRETVLAPAALARALADQGVTTMFVTTALFNLIVQEAPAALASLRTVLFGGEAADPARVAQCLAGGRPERLVHVYGPTETTTFASFHEVTAVAADAVTVPIGGALDGVRLRVLDACGQPVPAGMVGELFIGGAGLARGYLGRPALTAERFVPDPDSEVPGARLYRTGDRVRQEADGALAFVGRLDDQVKIRGFRVEPGEVAAALRRSDGVAEAAVVARGTGADRHLDAYVVARPGAVLDGAALRRELRGRLPDYAVPRSVGVLAALPLTANGKLDRNALPRPAAVARAGAAEPRGPVAVAVAAVLAEVLGRAAVGDDDNFFDLGGHSLAAMRVIARLRERLGVELPVRAVFEQPTAAGLAGRIAAALPAVATTTAVAALIPTASGTAPLPLSFAQQRLWFMQQLAPDSAGYNIPGAWRLRGRLDRAALDRALTEIVRRHAILRTRFVAAGGQPFQEVLPPFALAAEPFEPEGVDPEARLAEARGRINAAALRPFDLACGALIRAALYRLAEDDHLLFINLHHIIADGWSLGVFNTELAALYGTFAAGRMPALPPLPLQYADYAVWQRGWFQGAVSATQLAWWCRRLDGLTPLVLPGTRPRPATPSSAGVCRPLALSAPVTAALRALALAHRTSLFAVLLAVVLVLLHRATGREDLAVATPIANRRRSDVEGLIGFFANILVLRGRVVGDHGFRALLDTVREETLEAFARQDLPFERLVEALNLDRDPTRPPLTPVALALRNIDVPAPALPGLTVTEAEVEVRTTRFDVELHLREDGDRLTGLFLYGRDTLDAVAAEGLLADFVALAGAVAADPDAPVAPDRDTPPEPAAAVPAAVPVSADGAEPRTEAERAIAAVWCDLLGVGTVGLDDNFFDLGGHSLLVTQVCARVNERFGAVLTVVDLFQRPTLRALAEAVAAAGQPPSAPEADAGIRDRAERRRVAQGQRPARPAP